MEGQKQRSGVKPEQNTYDNNDAEKNGTLRIMYDGFV